MIPLVVMGLQALSLVVKEQVAEMKSGLMIELSIGLIRLPLKQMTKLLINKNCTNSLLNISSLT